MARSRTPPDPVSYPWDSRGLFLTALEVSFFAEAAPGSWPRVAAELGLQEDAPPSEGKLASTSFVALPEPLEKNALYLTGGIQPGADEEDGTRGSVHWRLSYERAPTSSPPARIQELSAKVGGYPVFLEKLCEKWPAERSIDAKINATYMVETLRLRPVFAKSFGRVRSGTVPGAAGNLKVTPQATATVWAVEPPSGPIRRLTLSSDGQHIASITVSGEQRLHLSPGIRDDIDASIWLGLQPFLET